MLYCNCFSQVGVRNAFDNRDIYNINFNIGSNESSSEDLLIKSNPYLTPLINGFRYNAYQDKIVDAQDNIANITEIKLGENLFNILFKLLYKIFNDPEILRIIDEFKFRSPRKGIDDDSIEKFSSLFYIERSLTLTVFRRPAPRRFSQTPPDTAERRGSSRSSHPAAATPRWRGRRSGCPPGRRECHRPSERHSLPGRRSPGIFRRLRCRAASWTAEVYVADHVEFLPCSDPPRAPRAGGCPLGRLRHPLPGGHRVGL